MNNNQKPKRIQRKCTKGWRMPENTVSIARPGKWGNPFKVGGWYKKGDPVSAYDVVFRMLYSEINMECFTEEEAKAQGYQKITSNQEAVDWFKWYTKVKPFKQGELVALRGKDLACWCKEGEPCHGDVLLKLANAPPF